MVCFRSHCSIKRSASLCHALVLCFVCVREANAWGLQQQRVSSTDTMENRKDFLLKGIASAVCIISPSTQEAFAAETVGKDPDCDDITCLGVWDGLLAGERMKENKERIILASKELSEDSTMLLFIILTNHFFLFLAWI